MMRETRSGRAAEPAQKEKEKESREAAERRARFEREAKAIVDRAVNPRKKKQQVRGQPKLTKAQEKQKERRTTQAKAVLSGPTSSSPILLQPRTLAR
jgi:hypothetical protein